MPAAEDLPLPEPTRQPPEIPIWAGVIAAVAAAAFATGGVIAAIDPALLTGGTTTAEASIYVDYTVSRDLALAAVILCTLARRARHVLSTLLLLAALIQIADLIQDTAHGRTILVPGVAALGAIFLTAAARLADHVPWRSAR